MSKYKSLNTKAWCCVFHSKVRKMFRSLPKEKQAEILKNIFKEEWIPCSERLPEKD